MISYKYMVSPEMLIILGYIDRILRKHYQNNLALYRTTINVVKKLGDKSLSSP